MDMFRKAEQAPAVAAAAPVTIPAQPGTPATPGNVPDQQVVATPENGVVPAVVPDASNVAQEPENPLDKHKEMWQTKPIDPDAPKPVEPPAPLTAEALKKSFATADFVSTLDPDIMTKIAAGGEEAGAAFTQAMNELGRQGLVQSTLINEKLTAKAVAAATEAATANIPELLRQQSAANHLKESNPIYSNPALKPLVEQAHTALLAKHPTATPAELTIMTEDYFKAVQESFAPAAPVDPTAPVGTDWEKFLTP